REPAARRGRAPARTARGAARRPRRRRARGGLARAADRGRRGAARGRRGDPDPRRLRLHGRVPRRAALPRREDPRGPRGRRRCAARRAGAGDGHRRVTRLATCAGFRADLLPAIAAQGATLELGDEVPFSTNFGPADRGLIAVVVAAARRLRDATPLAVDEIFAAACETRGSPIVARPLRPAAVAALACFGDLAVSGPWNEVWTRLGHDGPVPPSLGQPIRELVVQCRAAVANGWEVFVVEDGRG